MEDNSCKTSCCASASKTSTNTCSVCPCSCCNSKDKSSCDSKTQCKIEDGKIVCLKGCCVQNQTCCDLESKLNKCCVCLCACCKCETTDCCADNKCCKVEDGKIVCLKICCVANKGCCR